MDVGQPAREARIATFGTLGFEFAVGQNLLVINPGQNARDLNLQRLLCAPRPILLSQLTDKTLQILGSIGWHKYPMRVVELRVDSGSCKS